MIYVGLDDTDTKETRGTGFMARRLADLLSQHCDVWGVTRHQLLVDPRVPYTAKNSSSAVHIRSTALSLGEIADIAADFVAAESAVGSDPAVCVAESPPAETTAFGRRAQSDVIAQADARALAGELGIILRGLGGTQDGVIGSLAAVGLAAGGNDGRFNYLGGVRDLLGPQPVEALLQAGVADVRVLGSEESLREGTVNGDGKLRPALREGKAILYVAPGVTYWEPQKLD